MRKIFPLIILIMSQVVMSKENSRLTDHIKAVKDIKDFHLFRDGQGIIIGPGTSKIADLAISSGIFQGESLDDRFRNRWGLISKSKKDGKGFYGLNIIDYKKMKVMSLSCVVCHGGKAAGRYYVGLGNKNIDVLQMAKDAKLMQSLFDMGRGKLGESSEQRAERRRVAKNARFTVEILGNKNHGNLTQAMVPTAMIRSWFYRMANKKLPSSAKRGAVKVPHFWGYGKKRFVGQFSDGFGDGTEAAWGAAVELAAGQSHENVREYLEEVDHAEVLLGHLLPPRYPFKINALKAERGKKLFNTSCFKCHGTYERDKDGLPIFKEPKHIPWKVVKTDRDRLDANTPEFIALVESNPINDIMMKTELNDKKPGYFAPRLDGVWARFPYLHNASVPTIYDLISDPSTRPKIFSLKNAGELERFDQEKLGLTRVYKQRVIFKERGRHIFDTSYTGYSNQGHFFRSFQKFTHEDKLDIIEYLKTL